MKEKIAKSLKWFLFSFIWLGIILFVVDLVTKNIIVANKEVILANDGIVLIPGFLRINYIINNKLVMGLSFGNDNVNRILFIVFASLITGALIFVTVKKWDKLNKFYKACIMMIISGALGNLVDRIFYSPAFLGTTYNGVVDWIDFYGVWKFNFNIADSAVVVAAFMLIIYMIVNEIVDYVKTSKENPKEEKDNEKVLSKTEQEKNKYLEDKKDE